MSTLKELLTDQKELESLGESAEEYLEIVNKLASKKIDSVATFIKFSIPAQINALETKVERLKALEKSLKDYVSSQVREHGKLVGDGFRMRLQRNPAKLVIDDEGSIPDEFKKEIVVTSIKIDSKQIKQALENGALVPGCHLEYGDHLRIEEGD